MAAELSRPETEPQTFVTLHFVDPKRDPLQLPFESPEAIMTWALTQGNIDSPISLATTARLLHPNLPSTIPYDVGHQIRYQVEGLYRAVPGITVLESEKTGSFGFWVEGIERIEGENAYKTRYAKWLEKLPKKPAKETPKPPPYVQRKRDRGYDLAGTVTRTPYQSGPFVDENIYPKAIPPESKTAIAEIQKERDAKDAVSKEQFGRRAGREITTFLVTTTFLNGLVHNNTQINFEELERSINRWERQMVAPTKLHQKPVTDAAVSTMFWGVASRMAAEAKHPERLATWGEIEMTAWLQFQALQSMHAVLAPNDSNSFRSFVDETIRQAYKTHAHLV